MKVIPIIFPAESNINIDDKNYYIFGALILLWFCFFAIMMYRASKNE